MAQQTKAVRDRIDRLVDFYIAEGRDAALTKLVETLRIASNLLDHPGAIPDARAFPSTYQHLNLYGLRWFKLHAYWFGYAEHEGRRILTNFFYETNGMPNRVLLNIDELIDI